MIDSLTLDLLDSILITLPDFATLWSAIQVSKRINGVFKARPISIMTAVAYNEVGPLLPEAIRLIRFQVAGSDPDSPLLNGEGPELAVGEWHDARDLSEVASTVKAFEVWFSRRHKDRSVNSSRLSESESYRFRRAMYHFWLYQACFGLSWREAGELDDEPVDWDDENFNNQLNAKRDAVVLRQKHYIACQIPAIDQQKEFAAFFDFMVETLQWLYVALGSHSIYEQSILLTLSPRKTMTALQTRSCDHIDEIPEWSIGYIPQRDGSFVWDALSLLKVDRKNVKWTTILDEAVGDTDSCAKCGNVHGQELWNETNWDLLYGIQVPKMLPDLLKGNLKHNVTESTPLAQKLTQNFDYSAMMHTMFEENPDTGDWQGSKSDWLCKSCLLEFWENNLYRWWLHRKEDDAIVIEEDCWYGYDCRTQVHRFSHARRLNHLCAPTRGVPA